MTTVKYTPEKTPLQYIFLLIFYKIMLYFKLKHKKMEKEMR